MKANLLWKVIIGGLGSLDRTLVFGWLTFPDPRLIYGWHVPLHGLSVH